MILKRFREIFGSASEIMAGSNTQEDRRKGESKVLLWNNFESIVTTDCCAPFLASELRNL